MKIRLVVHGRNTRCINCATGITRKINQPSIQRWFIQKDLENDGVVMNMYERERARRPKNPASGITRAGNAAHHLRFPHNHIYNLIYIGRILSLAISAVLACLFATFPP